MGDLIKRLNWALAYRIAIGPFKRCYLRSIRFLSLIMFYLSQTGVRFLTAQQLDERQCIQVEPGRSGGACLGLNTHRRYPGVEPIGCACPQARCRKQVKMARFKRKIYMSSPLTDPAPDKATRDGGTIRSADERMLGASSLWVRALQFLEQSPLLTD